MIIFKLYNLIGEIIPMMLLFFIMAILFKIIYVRLTKKKGNIWIEFKLLVYVIYSFILFHLVTTTDFISYSNNFIPFKEIMRYKLTSPLFYRNVIGNVVVFIPFAYLVTDVIYMISKKNNFFISTIYIFITSLSIEIIQLFIGRAFDIDDIILNVLGGILGYVIFIIIHLITNKLFRRRK